MKTILVVDDEPKITQLVRDYLERAGFGVLVAYDGKKALSLAKTEKPDAVILDLGLPQLDGLDFTREFRKTFNAPIIMLTARSEESDKLIGLELGADDYMTKPFSPTEFELLATLARQPGRIYTRAQLLDAIHGVAFESYERAIDAHIKNIRRKIELKASEPQYILTVYGVGYKFVDK